MIAVKVPYPTLRDVKPSLRWRDIQFGLERQTLVPEVAIQHAVEEIENGSTSEDVLNLAILGPHDSVVDEVEKLAQQEPNVADDDLNMRMAHVLLIWLY